MFYDHEALLDQAVDMLDPDLRPVPPQPNCPDSMQIYHNHRQMAADFVKFQNDLVIQDLEQQLFFKNETWQICIFEICYL